MSKKKKKKYWCYNDFIWRAVQSKNIIELTKKQKRNGIAIYYGE